MATVLIVEDDRAMAVALSDGFAYEGFQVEVATDGEEGLRLAHEAKPDLMILDIMLPKMTGLEICKALRDEGSNLPDAPGSGFDPAMENFAEDPNQPLEDFQFEPDDGDISAFDS